MKKQVLALFLSLLMLLCATLAAAENAISAEEMSWPAPENLKQSEQNNLPYMGISYEVASALIERIENGEVFVYGDAEPDAQDFTLKNGFVDFRFMPDSQRNQAPYTGSQAVDTLEDFLKWFDTLEKLGRISVLHDSMLEAANVEDLTGYPVNEEIAKEGKYTLYYSSNNTEADAGAEALLPLLASTRESLSFSEPLPADDNFSWFTLPRYEYGDAIMPFATTDLNGNPVTESIFSNAKLTLLNVWATWCSPCVAEMPHLGELNREMADMGVQVVGIMADAVDATGGEIDSENIEMGRVICERTGADYVNLVPDATLTANLLDGIPGFPGTFFVDENGQIIGELLLGSRDKEGWRATIEEHLAMLEE